MTGIQVSSLPDGGRPSRSHCAAPRAAAGTLPRRGRWGLDGRAHVHPVMMPGISPMPHAPVSSRLDASDPTCTRHREEIPDGTPLSQGSSLGRDRRRRPGGGRPARPGARRAAARPLAPALAARHARRDAPGPRADGATGAHPARAGDRCASRRGRRPPGARRTARRDVVRQDDRQARRRGHRRRRRTAGTVRGGGAQDGAAQPRRAHRTGAADHRPGRQRAYRA